MVFIVQHRGIIRLAIAITLVTAGALLGYAIKGGNDK